MRPPRRRRAKSGARRPRGRAAPAERQRRGPQERGPQHSSALRRALSQQCRDVVSTVQLAEENAVLSYPRWMNALLDKSAGTSMAPTVGPTFEVGSQPSIVLLASLSLHSEPASEQWGRRSAGSRTSGVRRRREP